MIGVYDSGFGGLTILQALRTQLPAHDFVYLGDSGRAPYGGRDSDTLLVVENYRTMSRLGILDSIPAIALPYVAATSSACSRRGAPWWWWPVTLSPAWRSAICSVGTRPIPPARAACWA